MASIKIIVSDNFRAEYANNAWTIRATKKISKTLFRMKSMKSGQPMASQDHSGVCEEITLLEDKCFKLAEISGDA